MGQQIARQHNEYALACFLNASLRPWVWKNWSPGASLSMGQLIDSEYEWSSTPNSNVLYCFLLVSSLHRVWDTKYREKFPWRSPFDDRLARNLKRGSIRRSTPVALPLREDSNVLSCFLLVSSLPWVWEGASASSRLFTERECMSVGCRLAWVWGDSWTDVLIRGNIGDGWIRKSNVASRFIKYWNSSVI